MTFRYTYVLTYLSIWLLYIILVRIHFREMQGTESRIKIMQVNFRLNVNWRREKCWSSFQKKISAELGSILILILQNSLSFAIQFVHDLCLSLIIPFQRNVLYTLFWKSSIIPTTYIAQQFWVKTLWWWWYLITIYHSN